MKTLIAKGCALLSVCAVLTGLAEPAAAEGKLDAAQPRADLTAPLPGAEARPDAEPGANPAAAAGIWGDRVRLGYGRMFTNDLLGERRDRWRTVSLVSSRIYGPSWSGQAPASFGTLLELRLGGQIITPEFLQRPDPGDRRYAGMVFAGVHSHVLRGALDAALGLDLVATGPSTRLDALQVAVHRVLDQVEPSGPVRDNQIEDGLYPTLTAEIGRNVTLGPGRLRPFAETRLGDEVLARVGADLSFGAIGQGELLVRDAVTGHRYRAITTQRGLGVVMGADVAALDRSVYLPQGLEPTRWRARAGLHWRGDDERLFYGLTLLGPEFDAQDENQLVGSVQWNWRF